MTESNDRELVDKALQLLSEHYDTVQIFCTRHEPAEQDGTVTFQKGLGNWFARYGQVKGWLLCEEDDLIERRHQE